MQILVLGSGEMVRNFLDFPDGLNCFYEEDGRYFDLVAAMPGAEKRVTGLRCGTLLLWEEQAGALLPCMTAEQVVSCGFSQQCTLTPASTQPGGAVMTIQRALQRLDGTDILPQDIPLPVEWGALPLPQQMTLMGMMLLLGMLP